MNLLFLEKLEDVPLVVFSNLTFLIQTLHFLRILVFWVIQKAWFVILVEEFAFLDDLL